MHSSRPVSYIALGLFNQNFMKNNKESAIKRNIYIKLIVHLLVYLFFNFLNF